MTAAVEPHRGAPSNGDRLERYLGPARVVRVANRSLLLMLEGDTQVHATLALAFPYQPVADDQVLVIGDATAFWVIGVLHARGRTQLTSEGNVSIHAESGRLRLVGDRGIHLKGRRLHLSTQHLRRLAVTAVETFRERQTQVHEVLKIEAGEVDELSQRRWLMRAKRVVLKALTGARVKSTTVRLG